MVSERPETGRASEDPAPTDKRTQLRGLLKRPGVLALGIYAIVVGALLLTLARQNRAARPDATAGASERERRDRTRKQLAIALAGTGGLFIMNFSLFLTEFSERESLRGGLGQFEAKYLMLLALSNAGRMQKYGA